jgi:hypothetical protein
MHLTIRFLHLALVYLLRPEVKCLVSLKRLYTQQTTRFHTPEGRNCCFRLHGRPGPNGTARPEAVSFVMTSKPGITTSVLSLSSSPAMLTGHCNRQSPFSWFLNLFVYSRQDCLDRKSAHCKSLHNTR